MKNRLILILCFMTFQLRGQKQVSIQQSHVLLNGSWKWYRTNFDYRGPILNRNETPNTCNCTKKIVFRDKNILEYYSNDSLISTSNYTIENPPTESKEVLILRSDQFSGFLKFNADSLGIGWFGACATLNYFVKED